MRNFGQTLRHYRRARNMTLGTLAEKVGVSVAYLSDIERGRRAPLGPEKLAKAANALGVDLGELRRAASISRGVTLDTNNRRDTEQEAALALGRKWGQLDDTRLREILNILERDD